MSLFTKLMYCSAYLMTPAHHGVE